MPTEGDVWDAFRAVLASAPAFLYGKARIFAEQGLDDPGSHKPMRGVALRSQAAYVLGNLEGWNDQIGKATRRTLQAFLRESQEITMSGSVFEQASGFYKETVKPLVEAQKRLGKPLTEMDVSSRTPIKPGERGQAVMPHSEVMMHMRVAGKVMAFEFKSNGRSVQLYDQDGQPFSGSVTSGEAGIFGPDEKGEFYYYKS